MKHPYPYDTLVKYVSNNAEGYVKAIKMYSNPVR